LINFLKKLQTHFNARSINHLIIIFIVFSISGSVTVYLSFPIIDFLQLKNFVDMPFLEFLLRLLIIFPLYQIILIFIGALFGEFIFFFNFEKKFLRKLFLKKN